MIGQGRPSSSSIIDARTLQSRRLGVPARLLFLIAVFAGYFTPFQYAFGQDAVPNRPIRLRIAWGGGHEARKWVGRIGLSQGSFADMQLLGMDADAAGSIWNEADTIRIESIRPHRFDGIDISVMANTDARLIIELTADHLETPLKVEAPVADLMKQPLRNALDQSGNVLLVDRAPGDTLRIESDREQLIFTPGEEFSFIVRPVIEGLEPGTTIDVATTLTPARGGNRLWSSPEQRLPVPVSGEPSFVLNVPMPTDEGVYTIHLSLTHPPGFRDRFLPGVANKPLAERSFQVVVLKSVPEPPTGNLNWQSVLEIDPANPRWWQRLSTWTQLQRLRWIPERPLGSSMANVVEDSLGRSVDLPPTAAGGEPEWQTYPLPIEKVGAPHLLEVEYPADREQHFGLSIMEPNAAGRLMPVGRDSGVYTDPLGTSEQTERHTHRFVFWPRTNSPLLLVTNLHPSASARYGRIRVLRGSDHLAGSLPPRPWRDSERLVAAYISRPLFPEMMGASEGLDVASGQSMDDWQTFYEASKRLSDYLPYAGYNGAIVSVLADGSSIYPSERLLPSPSYNTGRMVTGTHDLPETDGLELLLRTLDRKGLALVPTLQFASPLPELESLRRAADPTLSGLEWVGPDGHTWLAVYGTNRGLGPYYNLLNDRVQQTLLDVAHEVLTRYGQHAAFAGLAVQLSGDGYSQLPGLDWGLDDATIADFQRDTGIQLNITGPDRFAVRRETLATEHGQYIEAWRKWRAARVTRFYRELALLVHQSGPDRRLLLTTEDMLSNPRVRTQFQPNVLATRPRLERLMFELGIDRKELEQAGAIVCPARFVGPASPLVDRAIDLEINEAVTLAERNATEPGYQAASFYHRPSRRRLASFDAKSPLPSYTLLVNQSSADQTSVRQQYALAMSERDPSLFVDGGELLPMGQEDSMRDVRRLLQQLPTHAQVTVEHAQPATIRTYAAADSTTIVVVNECPWRTEVEVLLELPVDVDLELLTGDTENQDAAHQRLKLQTGRQSWKLKLEPYAIQAARLTAAGVKVAEVRATIGEKSKSELAARVNELNNRVLTTPSTYHVLTNPGFEATEGGGPMPGWLVSSGGDAASIYLDTSNQHGGSSSLYFQNRGSGAVVESNVFTTPPTGQLEMAVYVRGKNFAPTTELRIVLEAESNGQTYRRAAVVSPSRTGAQRLDEQWKYKAFPLNDVPLDSQGRMRVKFELSGPGEVWIDDVQLYDLLFPLEFYEYNEAERLKLVQISQSAKNKADNGRVADSVRELEKYWPRFLMAYTPLIQPSAPEVANQTPPPPTAEAPSAEETPAPAPSLGERMKQWFPSLRR